MVEDAPVRDRLARHSGRRPAHGGAVAEDGQLRVLVGERPARKTGQHAAEERSRRRPRPCGKCPAAGDDDPAALARFRSRAQHVVDEAGARHDQRHRIRNSAGKGCIVAGAQPTRVAPVASSRPAPRRPGTASRGRQRHGPIAERRGLLCRSCPIQTRPSTVQIRPPPPAFPGNLEADSGGVRLFRRKAERGSSKSRNPS